MSQLLNALKRLDQKVAVEPPSAPPEAASEVIATPDPTSSVEEIVEQIDDVIAGDPAAGLTEGPDIVWPPDEPPSPVQEAVQEDAVQEAEVMVGTVIDDVTGELAEGADLVFPPESPSSEVEEKVVPEEMLQDDAAPEEVKVEPVQEVDDRLTSQVASTATPRDESPDIDLTEPTPSSQGIQLPLDPSHRRKSAPTRIVVPRVSPTITVDAETLQLCDRVLSQTPPDQSATIGLFRASPAQTDRQVALRLATGIAMRTGESVLVMDADWQRVDRSPIPARDAAVGMGEVLMEEVQWSEAIVQMGGPQVQVSLLRCGHQPAPQVAKRRFAPLINELRGHFHYILIDGGLAVAGSPVAGGECYDLAFLVSGLDQTDRVEAIEAATVLRNAGVDLQGCIVTYAA